MNISLTQMPQMPVVPFVKPFVSQQRLDAFDPTLSIEMSRAVENPKPSLISSIHRHFNTVASCFTGLFALSVAQFAHTKELSVNESDQAKLGETLIHAAEPLGQYGPWVLAAGGATLLSVGTVLGARYIAKRIQDTKVKKQDVDKSLDKITWFQASIDRLRKIGFASNPQKYIQTGIPERNSWYERFLKKQAGKTEPEFKVSANDKSTKHKPKSEDPDQVPTVPYTKPRVPETDDIHELPQHYLQTIIEDEKAGNIEIQQQAPVQEIPNLAVPSTIQVASYHILKVLGEGGHGRALLVVNKATDQQSVIKEIRFKHLQSESSRDSFIEEAKLYLRIDSPYVVRLFTFFNDPQCDPMMNLEYIEGGDLDHWVNDHANDAEYYKRIAIMFVDFANGLRDIRDQSGQVHRDIKPANLFLRKNMRGVIGDLGIAKPSGFQTVQPGGTPFFIAPEHVYGRPIDIRADLYSLGASLFYALTKGVLHHGEKLERHKHAQSLVHTIVKAADQAPSEVDSTIPEELNAITKKLMQKEPRNRYQSPEDLIEDLSCYYYGKPLIHAR